MKLTKKKKVYEYGIEYFKDAWEKEHDVYIDIAACAYNYHGYNSTTGWLPIPLKWFIGERG